MLDMHDQLTAFKIGYPLPGVTCLYRGLRCATHWGDALLLRSLLSSHGIQLIAGSQKFTSDIHFLWALTRALFLALTKSICHTMVKVVLTLVCQCKAFERKQCFQFWDLTRCFCYYPVSFGHRFTFVALEKLFERIM